MAKIQNNFLKGKMNKDLDERLVPKGEYREAQNILITDSEDSDVGAIENILGNALAKGTVPGIGANLRTSFKTIGYYSDTLNSKVYWFITDFSGFGDNIRTMRKASFSNTCKILMADLKSGSPIKVLVDGHFLNFSKNHLITGVNLIDDLLFWTDNYNQPRKINVTKALDAYNVGSYYYTTEEQISVAKYAPYQAPLVENLENSANVKSEFLKEKFVRFSYRYKYEDGEYTTMAPFTQIVFKPLNEAVITNIVQEDFNVQDVYQKTVVDLMKNSINKFDLKIPLPSDEDIISIDETQAGNEWTNDLRITNIEVLSKESDAATVKVIANIDVELDFYNNIETKTVTPLIGSSFYRYFYKHEYKSEEPYKSLTEDQITRVYDQVPVRAKAQEITGNRVVYGNFTENYNLPKDEDGKTGVNYVINSTTKGQVEYNATQGVIQNLSDSYKYHSIKQRRTYQVGLILADKFGRQSPVILTTNLLESIKDTITVDNFSLDLSNNFDNSYSWSPQELIYGKSLNIEFKDDRIVEARDVYNSDINSSNYNPHGWYSWKIVIKQKEQEYYNIYTTHPIDSWSNKSNNIDSVSGSSWVTLSGDNINKVTKDLTEIQADATVAGSDTRIFPKVIKDSTSSLDDVSTFGDSAQDPIEVITIGTSSEQGLVDEDDKPYGFLNTARDPLIAEIENFGSQQANNIVLYKATEIVAFSNTDDPFKVLIGNGNDKNPFIQPGQYIDSEEQGLIEDKIVYQSAQAVFIAQSLEFVGPTKTVSFLSNLPKLRVGQYLDFGVGASTELGPSSARAVIEKVTNATTSPFASTVELSRSISLEDSNGINDDPGQPGQSINIRIKEFTVVESVKESIINGLIFQEIELSKDQNLSPGGVINFKHIDESPVSVARGLTVFETEPFKSKLDIFYETSTSGLISDLNLQMGNDIDGPTNLRFNVTEFNESMDNGDEVGEFFADSETGNVNINYSLQLVTRGLDNLNVTSFFNINNGLLLLTSPLMHDIADENENETEDLNSNTFLVKFKATASDGGSTTETVAIVLQNENPTISLDFEESDTVVSILNAINNSSVVGGLITNGSANTSLDHENLDLVITNTRGLNENLDFVQDLIYPNFNGFNGSATWPAVVENGVTLYKEIFEIEQSNGLNSFVIKIINVNDTNTIAVPGVFPGSFNPGGYLQENYPGGLVITAKVTDSGNSSAFVDVFISYGGQVRTTVYLSQNIGCPSTSLISTDPNAMPEAVPFYIGQFNGIQPPNLTGDTISYQSVIESSTLFLGNKIFINGYGTETLDNSFARHFHNNYIGSLNFNHIETDEDGVIDTITACN